MKEYLPNRYGGEEVLCMIIFLLSLSPQYTGIGQGGGLSSKTGSNIIITQTDWALDHLPSSCSDKYEVKRISSTVNIK